MMVIPDAEAIVHWQTFGVQLLPTDAIQSLVRGLLYTSFLLLFHVIPALPYIPALFYVPAQAGIQRPTSYELRTTCREALGLLSPVGVRSPDLTRFSPCRTHG